MSSHDHHCSHLPRFFRAVELTPRGPVLRTRRLPNIGNRDAVVVEPILVGICRADLKEVQGTRPVRRDFGHEIIGSVRWAGPSVPLDRGGLVCFNPHPKISRSSGFGELVVAQGDPDALGEAFPELVRGIPPEKAVFCEPMACAQHCASNLLQYEGLSHLSGLRVGIIGAGNAGTLIGLIVKHLGATVTLINRSVDRLEFLTERQIFAAHELSPMTREIADTFDVVVAATSSVSPVLKLAIQVVRPRGLVLFYGGTQKGDLLPGTNLDIDFVRRKENLLDVVWRGKSFRVGGTYGALPRDFRRVMHLLDAAPNRFPVEHLITGEVALEDLPERLESLASSDASYRGKIVVRIV